MAPSSSTWTPPEDAPAVPWRIVERSLAIPHRWRDPFRLVPRTPDQPRRAAVAVVLWGDAEGARRVVLVRRGATAPHHAGELAFPGGMVDPGDRDLPTTARRELEEELGLRDGLWELGCYPDGLAKGRTRFTPVFLRWEERKPAFQVGPEIQDVLTLPLGALPDAPWKVQRLEIRGLPLFAPRLELAPTPLWGATALVLRSWLDVLSRAAAG